MGWLLVNITWNGFYLLKKYGMQCMTEHIILTFADFNYVEPNVLK